MVVFRETKLKKFLIKSIVCFMFLQSVGFSYVQSPALKLIEESCLECHDEDLQKGNLRLDNLDPVKVQPKHMSTWLKIYDNVKSGKMPPPKKAFEKDEQAEFLAILGKELSEFDSDKNSSVGRVVFRRLSSAEYEYAMRDLLHIPELKIDHFLPGDSQYHGIKNVADRQQIAYNQIAQYLEAAEMSLHSALALTPEPRGGVRRVTAGRFGASRKAFNNAYKMVGEKLVLIKEPELSQGPWGLISSPDEPGYYKIRLKAHSAQIKNNVLMMSDKKVPSEHLLPGKSTQTVTLGVSLGRYFESFDLTPESKIFESTVWLHGDERLSIHCNDLPLRISKYVPHGKPNIWDGVALEWFEIEGPILQEWPPKSHQALFGKLPIKKWNKRSGLEKPRSIYSGTGVKRQSQSTSYYVDSKHPERDSYQLLEKFMTRAYRRSVDASEVKVMQARVLDALEQKVCFHDAMLIAYKAILSSPDFLYFQEEPGKLSNHALASRLSFYLWRSIPDEHLFNLARVGELHKTEVLHKEIRRMLQDPKSKRFIDDFTSQWLDLESIYATTPDKTLYPEYHEDSHLITALVDETLSYSRHMLYRNLPILNFIDSDFTFLNKRLADHYDLPGLKGSQMRKVNLPEKSVRGGVLTHGSMMKITANGFTTSPIKRGIWVVDRILGTPPPPPPPNAGSIEPDIRGAKTIREQLTKHREVESCASCHKTIDPPGFALECFDVMGAFRDSYRSMKEGKKQVIKKGMIRYDVRHSLTVDATGEYEGEHFSDIHAFKSLLSKDERQIARNIVERLVTQATGAIPTFSDRKSIERILDRHEEEGYPFRRLVTSIIHTTMFKEK